MITYRNSRMLRETISPVTMLMRGFKEPLENVLTVKGGQIGNDIWDDLVLSKKYDLAYDIGSRTLNKN